MTDSVVVGYVHPGTVRGEFCASLLDLVVKGKAPVQTVLQYQSGPNISGPRNLIVRSFLEDYPDVPWLLMVDTDMWFPDDTAARLIEAADPLERPLLGALCFSQNHEGAPFPTMYEMVEADPPAKVAFARYKDWPEDTCVRVSATGAACLLMHRSALHRIETHGGDTAAPWFRETPVGPMALMGEDMTFCLRAAAAGIPVHVHTGVRVGHMKTTMLI